MPIIWHSVRTIFEIGSQANALSFVLSFFQRVIHPLLSRPFFSPVTVISFQVTYKRCLHHGDSFTSFSDPRWRSQGFHRNCHIGQLEYLSCKCLKRSSQVVCEATGRLLDRLVTTPSFRRRNPGQKSWAVDRYFLIAYIFYIT